MCFSGWERRAAPAARVPVLPGPEEQPRRPAGGCRGSAPRSAPAASPRPRPREEAGWDLAQGRGAHSSAQWPLLTKCTTDTLGSWPVFSPLWSPLKSWCHLNPRQVKEGWSRVTAPTPPPPSRNLHNYRNRINPILLKRPLSPLPHHLAFGSWKKNKSVEFREICFISLPSAISQEEKKKPNQKLQEGFNYTVSYITLNSINFFYFFCKMKSKVYTLILLTLPLLSK